MVQKGEDNLWCPTPPEYVVSPARRREYRILSGTFFSARPKICKCVSGVPTVRRSGGGAYFSYFLINQDNL